jgi:hypothetical protein
MSDDVAELKARQAILDGMYWYCASLSRLDKELFGRSFHADATLQYPYFEGPWEQIRDFLFESFEKYSVRTMQLAQAMVVLGDDGTTATAESYVTATFWVAGEATGQEFVPGEAGGVTPTGPRAVTTGEQHCAFARYVDEWSERDGRWALDHRRAVVDFYTTTQAEGWIGDGQADRQDPSYALAGFAPAR